MHGATGGASSSPPDSEKHQEIRRESRTAALDDGLLPARTPQELVRMTRDYATRLGGGGFSSVYEGFDDTYKEVAVKILKPQADDAVFFREVRNMSRARHVNLITIYALCEEQRAIIMQRMNSSLQDRLEKGDLSWMERLGILHKASNGLRCIHKELKLEHRDIKPANILLSKDLKDVRITDYGLATNVDPDTGLHTCHAVNLGTEQYMEPGEKNMKANDIYGFGVTILVTMSGLFR